MITTDPTTLKPSVEVTPLLNPANMIEDHHDSRKMENNQIEIDYS